LRGDDVITVESKLELFNKVVLEKAKRERAEMLKKLEKEKENLLEAQKNESIKKADHFLKAIIDEAYEDKKAMLARAKSDLKKQVLNQRQALIDQLAESVLRRFEAFVNEPSYSAYLEGLVDQHKEDLKGFGGFTVVLEGRYFERDKAIVKHALETIDLFAKAYIESPETVVGGCIFYNESQDILIDGTLVSLIEEHHREIGQRMYVMLNEVGDQNEG
jgi:vacuolar-type H+-ATPase subunit E/Vma4